MLYTIYVCSTTNFSIDRDNSRRCCFWTNVQGLAGKTSSTTDLFTGIEANLLVGYLCYYTSASTLPPSWVIKDILLAVGFKLCTSKSCAYNITNKLIIPDYSIQSLISIK